MKTLLSLLMLTAALSATTPDAVLDTWLGSLAERETQPTAQASLWFRGGPKVDAQLTRDFGDVLHQARYGAYLDWRETPRSRLALVILLDQFSRNIHRDSPEAFATDALSLALVLDGIATGDDLGLLPVERMFFYMPLQHAEDVGIQKLSIEKFTQLAEQSPENFQEMAKNCLAYALRHQEIIERFGRFPHRNEILGRASSLEEIAFLKEPNSSF